MLLALIEALVSAGEVAVARADLYPGEAIDSASIELVGAEPPRGCLDGSAALGRVPHRTVFAGTCVREVHLLNEGTEPGPGPVGALRGRRGGGGPSQGAGIRGGRSRRKS